MGKDLISKVTKKIMQEETTKSHEEGPWSCCICFSSDSGGGLAQLECHHQFHSACIIKSLRRDRRCPVCRGFGSNIIGNDSEDEEEEEEEVDEEHEERTRAAKVSFVTAQMKIKPTLIAKRKRIIGLSDQYKRKCNLLEAKINRIVQDPFIERLGDDMETIRGQIEEEIESIRSEIDDVIQPFGSFDTAASMISTPGIACKKPAFVFVFFTLFKKKYQWVQPRPRNWFILFLCYNNLSFSKKTGSTQQPQEQVLSPSSGNFFF